MGRDFFDFLIGTTTDLKPVDSLGPPLFHKTGGDAVVEPTKIACFVAMIILWY
jgi:hypothetical protein